MNVEAGILFQIAVVLFAATGFFALSYWSKIENIVTLVVVLTPFQFIDSPYGTSNVAIIFIVFLALFMRGAITKLPLWGPVVFVFLAMLVSLSFTHQSTWKHHLAYMLSMGSAVILFYLVYNAIRNSTTPNFIINALIIQNCILVVYCIIQLLYGDISFKPFGINEFKWIHGRGGSEPRLTGPFRASGITAEYFLILIMLYVNQLLSSFANTSRLLLGTLMFFNLGLMVATGNRTALIILAVVLLPYLIYHYRLRVNAMQMIGLLTSGVLFFVLASTILINFTSYGVIFDRLAGTEVENGVPDTRAVTWPMAIDAIEKKPVFGHGPRLRLPDDFLTKYKGHDPIQQPHNLFLFILYTLGFFGLVAYLFFFWRLFLEYLACWQTKKAPGSHFESTAALGLPILALVMMDQLKVEAFRFSLMDYTEFLFCLFGFLLAYCHISLYERRE